MKGFRYIVENGLTWVNMSHVFRSGTNSEDTIWVLNHIWLCAQTVSYSLVLVATTESRTDQLEWTSYLILTCPGTCIDTVFVLCLLFMISSYRCIIHPGHAAIEDIMQILPELDALFVEEGVTFAREDLVNTVPWSMSCGIFWLPASRSNGCWRVWRVGSWYNDDVWKTV